MLTAAAVGAELTLQDQPNLPVTPEQAAADAARCEAEGASVYHLHVRDEEGRPTMSVERFREVSDAIAASSNLIVQFTTGGALGDREEERIAPLALAPEMATLTPGSVNLGDGVFTNPPPLVRRLYERMGEAGVRPEFEVFEAGMIAAAERLAGGAGHHLHFDLVLGAPGAMPAWPDAPGFLAAHLPEGATWSATGVGRAFKPVAAAAIEAGGHVRTGLEDVLHVGPGEKATSNPQLVAIVAAMAESAGRRIVEPDEARKLLGLSSPGRR